MQKKKFHPFPSYSNRSIFIGALLLSIFGLFMIASAEMSRKAGQSSVIISSFIKQTAYIIGGVFLMGMAARFPLHGLRKDTLDKIYYLFIALLFLPRLQASAGGAYAWVRLGPVTIQPSEFAKVAVILFLAWLINRNVKKISKLRIMSGMMLSILPVVGLVGASNLSTAIIILGIAVTLIFVASPRYAQFIWMAVSGVGFLGVFLALESYRLERLAIWRNPEKYEKGYQTLQGLYAIGSGGLFGRGLGNSVQKLGFLPEAQNDMIFSIVCEELGLVGAGTIIVLFLILIWRFFVIATHAPDLFGALIAVGAMAHMMIQVILNIAVVTNSIPNTGITLPFISYGGTSVVFLLLEMGLVLSISRLVQ